MATKKSPPPERGLFGPVRKGKLVPSVEPQASSIAIQYQRDELIDHILHARLAGEIKVSLDGTIDIRAKDVNGATITLSTYVNAQTGYREGAFSALPQRLSPTARREEAHRLDKLGLTQEQIARRLGVTQRTICSDLKKQ